MSSAIDTAEQRFRQAFERLKDGNPQVLPRGTVVSQNNVAREAGTDPTALRKARYPALIREIQAWVDTESQVKKANRERKERHRRARDNSAATIARLEQQRDHAQSQFLSAQRVVLEQLQEIARLQARLDDLLPPPTSLPRR